MEKRGCSELCCKKQNVKITRKWAPGTEAPISLRLPDGRATLRLISQSLWQQNQTESPLLGRISIRGLSERFPLLLSEVSKRTELGCSCLHLVS